MGMFDYKDYSSEEAAQLVDDANRLSVYNNAFKFFNIIPGGEALNFLGSLTGDSFANPINVAIPDGWKELSATDLGVSQDLVDKSGYFTIESLYTGTAVEGPQAKIFGQYNEAGELVRINLNFTGTNGLPDILDYINLNSREGVELFEPILAIVKDYAIANGLTGEEVLISGYSLGAAVTNVVAAEREHLADGFFTESDYMGFAVPTIYPNSEVVLNYGYENDVVHRITGDADDLGQAILDMDFGFVNNDREFEGTTDNLVLFNDLYGSALWDISPFSILAIPTGWFTHINGVTTDSLSRIKDSSFYEFTKQDSTVIVSDMTTVGRATTWVSDRDTHTSDHFGTSAFLIGTRHNDLIAGGSNSDYIDGGLGDDIIRAGIGVDHIDGNLGRDQVRVEGRGKDWDVYKMQDDTLFFVDKKGANLVEADNVESVSFSAEIASHMHNYKIGDDGLIDARPVMKWLSNGDKVFLDHVEGTTGDDACLKGKTVFGRDGDDTLVGLASDDMLHAGMGNDRLMGNAGNDRLFGAEGDDILIGGKGNDTLVGGIGNDTFVIDRLSGSDVIVDFNNDEGYQDILQFSIDLFADTSALASHTSQSGNNVIVTLSATDHLTVANCSMDDVLACSILA